MVGWSETKRQLDGGIVIMSWEKEGRKEGGVGPKKQVWGKAGLAQPPPAPTHAALPGAGPGKGQRSRAANVGSVLTSHSSPSSHVNKAERCVH